MADPSTNRYDLDPEGEARPCVHMTDQDGDEMAVHLRGDGKIGFYLECRTTVQLFPNLPPMPAASGVFLTQSQAQELCDYFRSVL